MTPTPAILLYFRRPYDQQEPESTTITDRKPEDVQKGIRDAIAQFEQDFNAIASALLGTEEFAKSASALANIQLQLQHLVDGHMTRQLARLNMPSVADIAMLGDRMTEIDERLVRIEETLQHIKPKARSKSRVRPPRTKQPDK